MTLSVGISCGMVSIIVLCLYMMEEAFRSNLYTEASFLWIAPFVLTAWMLRIWLLAHRGELDDDPVVFAIRDPWSLCFGVILFSAFVLATFVSINR